jgi:hypothetical protein
MTIREFNSIVMGAGGLFVDLPENRRGIPHLRRAQPKKPRCVMGSPFVKAISVPGKRQTAVSVLSGAASRIEGVRVATSLGSFGLTVRGVR